MLSAEETRQETCEEWSKSWATGAKDQDVRFDCGPHQDGCGIPLRMSVFLFWQGDRDLHVRSLEVKRKMMDWRRMMETTHTLFKSSQYSCPD